MKSILDNRPVLAREVSQVAEVAGYLWQKGWAERNGGNITLNITEWVDDEIRQLPALSETIPIGLTLPHLKGTMADGERFCYPDNGRLFGVCDHCRPSGKTDVGVAVTSLHAQ